MTLKDKYTYLALMALAMFGIGFWMLSIGGGASNPPSIPDPLAQQSSVSDQFKGSLNLGNERLEEKLKEILLIPKTFKKFGTTKCEKGEKIVRNFLKPGEASYYLSHESDLTARDYLRRIDPVNFYHLVLHFNSKENKWASLGTNVGNIAVMGDMLDTYKIPAGEPVLVMLIGFQEKEDKDTYFDPATGETKKLVFVKHCQNSFPDNFEGLNTGWNLIVSDLVQVADDPHALSVAALDSKSVVANMDLNMIQGLSNQLEGILSWVKYDKNKTREGFNADSSVPRLGFDLESESEVVLSFNRMAQEIASYNVVPQNSPNIKAVALRATNIEGFEFSDLFTEVFFRINGEKLRVSDLESDTLIAYFDDLDSDDLFAEGPMKISVFGRAHSNNSVENLQLGMVFDLGEYLGESRVAKTILPPLFVEFESIVADTYFKVSGSDAKLQTLELEGDDNRAKLVFKLLNNTRNSVNVNSIYLPFKSNNGLSEVKLTPAFVDLGLQIEDYEGNDTAVVTSKGIYLYPNKEVELVSKKPLVVDVVFKFDEGFNSTLEFKKIEIDTNEIDMEFDNRVVSLVYKNEGAMTLPSQMTAEQNENLSDEQQDSDADQQTQVAVNEETQSAFGDLFGGSSAENTEAPETDSADNENQNVAPEATEQPDQSESDEQENQPRLPIDEENEGVNEQPVANAQAPDIDLTSLTNESFGYVSDLSSRVTIVDYEPELIWRLELDDEFALDGFNLSDFRDTFEDDMSIGVLLDEEFIELSKESFGASDGNIYLRKNNPLSGEFSGVRLGLLNEAADEFDFYVNSISVFETVDSMTNFRPLITEVVTVESSEQAMEYELLEYDYTFDNPEDDISVASLILRLDEGNGYELKERYKSDGSLFDPENIPNADILEYEMVIVAEFEPGFFIERDDIKLDIKFIGSPAEENEFEFQFERQQRLNVYEDYQVNPNNELILFDGKLKTNNAIKFYYDFASDSETLIDQITDIEFISLDGGVSDVAFEYESKLYSPQELFAIQQSVQADGGDMEFYLVVLSEDEFLEFQAIKISLESGEKFFIENDGEPFSFILNEKQPVKQTKETLNEE